MSPPGPLQPVERLLLAYAGITGVIAVVRWPAQPALGWVLGANLLVVVLVHLARRSDPGGGGGLRVLYPLLLLGAFYPSIEILNNFGGALVHDRTVQAWESALFGAQWSRRWWQSAPSQLWSTALHGVYFAYYPIVLGPPVAFVLGGRIGDARRSVLWLMGTFLGCYLTFIVFPVAGPYYEFPRPDAAFLDNAAARLVYATLSQGSAYGAAFPSSHVAATLVAAAAAWRASRVLGAALAVPAALLTIGVVYCQMHYVVDALAGIVVAAVVVAVGVRADRPRPASIDG